MPWTDWFRRAPSPAADAPAPVERTPQRLTGPSDCGDLVLADAAQAPHGLPLLDWNAVHAWLRPATDEAAADLAWAQAERAWLLMLRDALGPGYRLRQQGRALLLSALEDRPAQTLLDFVLRTQQRVERLLDGLAQSEGRAILVVFEDAETYYRYTASYEAEGGEYGLSAGMHIHAGCSHFVTTAADLRAIEPVIAHELTHACLSHLPIPAWLNEGLAVNTELRLCPPLGPPERIELQQHRAYWSAERLQAFWCGSSFRQSDEGQELSYDLARLLVEQFAADGWPRFRDFALAAHGNDTGHQAAHARLGLDLGEALAALLDRSDEAALAPDPARWPQAPERGAF